MIDAANPHPDIPLPVLGDVGTASERFERNKFLMDVTPDSSRTLDRRIVVGLAVVLDNAESR